MRNLIAAYEKANIRLARKMALMLLTVQGGVHPQEWHAFLRNLRTLIDDVLSYDVPDGIVVQVDNPLTQPVSDIIAEAQPRAPDHIPEEWTRDAPEP